MCCITITLYKSLKFGLILTIGLIPNRNCKSNNKRIIIETPNVMKFNQTKTWDLLLLVIRIWLGYRLITASFSSITGMLTSAKERQFFIEWFGNDLHFPFPLYMAFIAKFAELSGGFFVIIGLYTRIASTVIAFTMFVATVTANLGKDFVIDGGFTISYLIFALVLLVWGAGKYSLDNLMLNKAK
jgi:putative oxidoreductase